MRAARAFSAAVATRSAACIRVRPLRGTVRCPSARAVAVPLCGIRDALARGRSARGDFPETVIGTQIVLEALGEVLLARLERGLVRHGTGLVRLRRMILAQEAAHHAFGCALVAALLAAGTLTARSLRERALPYRELAQRMIAAASPALHHFALTPDDIARDFAAQLEHTGFA